MGNGSPGSEFERFNVFLAINRRSTMTLYAYHATVVAKGVTSIRGRDICNRLLFPALFPFPDLSVLVFSLLSFRR